MKVYLDFIKKNYHFWITLPFVLVMMISFVMTIFAIKEEAVENCYNNIMNTGQQAVHTLEQNQDSAKKTLGNCRKRYFAFG